MAILKNLLGNSARDRELSDEIRAAVQEIRGECERFDKLLSGSAEAALTLTNLNEPIVRASSEIEGVSERLAGIEQKLESLSSIAARLEAVESRAQELSTSQDEAAEKIKSAVQDSGRIREVFEELAEKTDMAESLRERLESFLEIEKPFQLLRSEGEGIRGQIDQTTEALNRLREQHDRLMDAHKLATSKIEALDRRREELSRDLTDKERRVVDVESVVREMDGIRTTVNEVKRSMGSLKTLSDSVAQKTAAMEAQREAVERALAQADQLERVQSQLQLALSQQQENEAHLTNIQESLVALDGQHDAVLERSREIAQVERESEQQLGLIKDQVEAARGEVKNAVERFDFEGKGMEAVSQRVADLRSALSEFLFGATRLKSSPVLPCTTVNGYPAVAVSWTMITPAAPSSAA